MSLHLRCARTVFAIGMLVSCSRPGDPPTPERKEPSASPSAPAIAHSWAQEVRKVHESADHAETHEALVNHARRMEQLAFYEARPPQREAIQLAQDLAARSALLYLRASQPDEARRVVLRGLRRSDEPSASRTQLFMTLADAEEALGHGSSARKALLEALAINQQLFKKELETP